MGKPVEGMELVEEVDGNWWRLVAQPGDWQDCPTEAGKHSAGDTTNLNGSSQVKSYSIELSRQVLLVFFSSILIYSVQVLFLTLIGCLHFGDCLLLLLQLYELFNSHGCWLVEKAKLLMASN